MIRSACLLLVFVLAFSVPSGAREIVNTRVVLIEAAVTPGFQALPNWRSDFERRLNYASRIFENEFKIKFKLVRYLKWNPPDETVDMLTLLEQLRGQAPLTNVDLVIGLTHYRDAPNAENKNDLHTIGQARPFTGHLIIRYPAHKLFRVQEDTVLTHELGHVFGAVHIDDSSSIMSPAVQRQIPVRFDSINRKIIAQTRAINFQHGAESLPPDTLRTLLESYLKMAVKNDSADFFYALGLFYVQLGQAKDAVKAWKSALELEPENAALHYSLGTLYFKMNDFSRAITELSQTVSSARFPAQKPMQASALTMLGEAYYEQDNMFAAYNAWTRAAAMKPKDMELKVNLAMVKLKQGQIMEAIRTFEMILLENPHHIKTLTHLGKALSMQGRDAEGLRYLELALAQLNRKPKTRADVNQLSLLYAEIGSIYLKLNQQPQAFEHFQAACDLTPTADCHKKLGTKLFDEHQWDAAAREFATVLRQNKTDPDIYGMLGTALTQKGDLLNALGIFQEGLKYAQDNKMIARLHRNIGNLFLSQRAYDNAVIEFQLALSKDWNDGESRFGLAMSQLGKGETVSAVNNLRDILRVDPDNQTARDLLLKIQDNLNSESPQ